MAPWQQITRKEAPNLPAQGQTGNVADWRGVVGGISVNSWGSVDALGGPTGYWVAWTSSFYSANSMLALIRPTSAWLSVFLL